MTSTLEGLTLPDNPAFEERLFFRRDTLEQQALQTLYTLVEQLIRQGAPQEALLFAQRLVTLEPLHEGAYQHLMQIHAALGDRDGMRHQYRLCVDVLAREALLDRQGRRAEQAKDVEALLTVAEALGGTDRLAVVYKRQVGFYTYTGRYEEAQRVGERALALCRAAGDRAGEAQTLRELGFLHWSAGDYGTALAYGRQALQLHRYLGDTGAEATALHNVAEIYRELGSPRQAVELYEQALNLHWAQIDRRGQGLTLYSMAHALRQQSDLQRALTGYQRALALCQASGDQLMLSRVHHALASLQWELGAPDQALAHLQHALRISREIGYGQGIAYGLITLGHFHAQQGERHTARQHFEEAITWLRLIEDQAGLTETQARLDALEQGTLAGSDRPTTMGWVKSHVTLAEGKVYCEFESPMARHQP